MIKKSSALFALLSCLTLTPARALTCSFTEDEGTPKEKTTEIPLDNVNAHGMKYFDLNMASGFIAAANGYLVVNVVLKENGQVFSMNTVMTENTTLGGTVFTPNNARLMRISCR